jgi:hypothetical protein
MLFAHLKRVLGLDRLRLCGPSGAQFEFTLATIAQNLRRLAKIVSRPQPAIALGAAGSQRNRSSLDRRLLQRNRPISAGPLLSGESPVTETQRAIAMLGSTLSLRAEQTEAGSNCSPLDGSRFRRQNDRSGRSLS